MRPAAVVASAALVAAAAVFAWTQEPAPESALSEAQVHRNWGALAWRRAVWRAQRDDFQRVVTELENARAAPGGAHDFTTLYLLGVSYLRLGRVNDATPVLRDARVQAPNFPGLVLTDALQLTATKAENAGEARREAEEAVVRYDEYLQKLDAYPKDADFAQELRFLGHYFRGRTHWRLNHLDDARKDLTRALEITNEAREKPAAELVWLLAQANQSLNYGEAAKRVIHNALTRDPAEAGHYYNFGLLLIQSKEYVPARGWFEAALARHPQLVEAHLKLAWIAWNTNDTAAMLRNLEATAHLLESRAAGGVVADPGAQADLATGFGIYWKLVAEQRVAADDSAGSTEAYEKAERLFREALAKEPGCVVALNFLIQILSLRQAPQAEIEALKARLNELQKLKDRKLDPYRSTFCRLPARAKALDPGSPRSGGGPRTSLIRA